MTTTTTSMKMYGKDPSEYENVDVDDLLEQLTPEEIEMLSREVDPDDSLLPPNQRCSYQCEKEDTGPLNRKQLIDHINKQALEEPDRPELVPFQPGITRGKKWVPPPQPPEMQRAEEQIAVDLGDEYERALDVATEEELVDLAAILGFHSMMNQDQYHASLLNKERVGLGWDGITKASQPKPLAPEPPNQTDPEESIQRVLDDDATLLELNWNNIKNISEEKFGRLFDALKTNTRLEVLSLSNTGMNDKTCEKLVQTLEQNSTLRTVSVESNFLSPSMVARLVKALLVHKTIEEFRAANQRSHFLGNKIEMEITKSIEDNPAILRLGIHFQFNDARNRVATHLQKNLDRFRLQRIGGVQA